MPTMGSELTKIPYLDVKAIGDRKVNVMPFWDGVRWHLWIPNGLKLIPVTPVEAVLTDYVADLPARESDLFIPFVNTVWQRACWAETYPIIRAICDDFHCLAASVAKLKHIHRSQKELGEGVSTFFAATEVQYICVVSRGIFDLLQEVIAEIWDSKITLLDPEREKKRKSRRLPKTFSKVVMKDKATLKSVEEISNEYFLPDSLAQEYVKQAEFFQVLRDYRDKIVHGYSSAPVIFTTERGFCVDPTMSPFDQAKGWTEDQKYNDNLFAILPWLNQIISQTIDSCNSLMLAFEKQIQFPPEIAPGYKIYVRGLCNDSLIEIHKNVSWWD